MEITMLVQPYTVCHGFESQFRCGEYALTMIPIKDEIAVLCIHGPIMVR